LLLLLSGAASAHVPKTGQVARFQPNVLRNGKPFQTTGTVFAPHGKAGYKLEWYAPGRYQVTLTAIPASAYATESPAPSWTLDRDRKLCTIKTDRLVVNCPAATSWSLIELGGLPDSAAKALKDEGFFSDADVAWTETDGRDPKELETKDRRVKIALASNGKLPVAALEIRGPSVNVDVPGEEHPLVQFDQTFLAPLLSRFQNQGDLVTIQATSDLEVSREQPRFSHILSRKLDVFFGKTSVASFVRKDPVPFAAVKVPAMPTAITDHTALESQLSVEGKALLKALLLTH
jgi:hypothetical protein